MRIVSLIASATEIVHALGLGRFQVGRSHECDFPEAVKLLPVCTRPRFDVSGSSAEIDRLVKETLRGAASIYEVFEDLLESLQPTHILTQTQCKVCAVSLDDVERALGDRYASRPRVVALEPNSMADIWADIRRVGEACELPDGGQGLVSRLKDEMAAIAARTAGAGKRPTVACIEWLEPLMAAGNWTPELIEMAAGQNLFGEARRHSPWLEWDAVRAADPDVLIAAACGFDIARTRAEMHWLENRPGWSELKAVRTGRVFIADGNRYFNRPGPRVVETVRALAEMLHPGSFGQSLAADAYEVAAVNA